MLLSTAACLVMMLMQLLFQPSGPASVWDGVYTPAQADRGRETYATRCGRCHAGDLRGVNGSSLAGDAFMLHWEGRTVERLFRRIRDTMPPQGTGTLSETEALDTVAYLLQRNGFPQGAFELTADPAALAGIQIQSRAGEAVVRSGALVQSTGCLARDRDQTWLLTDATEPEVTTLDAQPAGAEPSRSGGTRTISLLNVFPNPAVHQGHTMRAKGFLIREAAATRINVVALDLIESQCSR